ncbi:alpha/beta fold hydrolase [Terrihabitans sp. B22-R8]|uniref:alpha/beta fold hydrolase n=1 Tax=Terrihabitans sp. B22-R8 TaxID=3425128 RepID=UPI00403C63CC
MTLRPRTVRLPQADIAVIETSGTGIPVVFLHGNSSCKEVFQAQFDSSLGEHYRMLALDLPGHGSSSDAYDVGTYSISGYADSVLGVLDVLGVINPVIVGWSLGGHVGIELLGRNVALRGLMIIGAPPFAKGVVGLLKAFHPHLSLLLATKGRLSSQDVKRFADTCLDGHLDPFLIDMMVRTDPRARPHLFRSMMGGENADQRALVAHTSTPVAVLNGAGEPFARLDHLAELSYGHLWENRTHVIRGAGHAPFRTCPTQFNDILGRFLADAEHQIYSSSEQPASSRKA